MKDSFIHKPIFRLLSPIFSGTIAYLLILLIYNNVEQITEDFLGQELFFCIGLTYLIQEVSVQILKVMEKWRYASNEVNQYLILAGLSLSVCIMLVILGVGLYYKLILGFSPSNRELMVFGGVYGCMNLIYFSLYVSHQFLFRMNQEKLQAEQRLKKGLEEDFRQFRKGINADLLFESFETMIMNMQDDPEKTTDLVGHLSSVYRYILGGRGEELVSLEKELRVLQRLISLFNYLPHRKVNLEIDVQGDPWIVSGSILTVVEQIIRNAIPDSTKPLPIRLTTDKQHLLITFESKERLSHEFSLESLKDVVRSYQIYGNSDPFFRQIGPEKIIGLPQLFINEPVV